MPLTPAALQAKRATLAAQVEQHVGQINRINGAVAQLDELILELESEREAVWDDPYWSTKSNAPEPDAAPPLAPSAPSMTPPSPPEMFAAPLAEAWPDVRNAN